MKRYLIVLVLIIIVNSCNKKIEKRSELEQQIDVIFKVYKKENYINASVLELYSLISIDCNNIEKILSKVYYDDQDSRKSGNGDMFALDSINRVKVISIMKNCNNLVNKELSMNSYMTIFLVLQHSGDKDLMVFYYDVIKKFVAEKKMNKLQFALYIDRFLMLDNEPQIFGTQMSNGNLYKSGSIIEVDKRRKSIGLNTISDYLKNGGNRLVIFE